MPVKFTMMTNALDSARTYVLEIQEIDLLLVPLDSFERKLIQECCASGSVADKLLALETIVRRIESAAPSPKLLQSPAEKPSY